MPLVELGSNVVQFDEVQYDVDSRATFTIRNTGKVLAQYRFVPQATLN